GAGRLLPQQQPESAPPRRPSGAGLAHRGSRADSQRGDATMSEDISWRLPLSGDGRSFRPDAWNRGDYSPHRNAPHPFARTGNQRDGYTYYEHLSQIARAAELT